MSGLTQERLRALLNYDPETGLFTYKVTRGPMKAGTTAGTKEPMWGHIRIIIARKHYFAHRLAWLWMTGEWPAAQIDHANLVSDDNRWTNLRAATGTQNRANTRTHKNNLVGVKGVRRSRQKWRAQIAINRTTINVGTFDTKEQAAAAYAAKARELYGEFARAA